MDETKQNLENDMDIKKLLKRLEWCGTADFQLYTVPRCPVCGGLKADTTINHAQTIDAGHAPDCELKKAIDKCGMGIKMGEETKQNLENEMNRIQGIIDAIGLDPKRSEQIGAELTSILEVQGNIIHNQIVSERFDIAPMQDAVCDTLAQMISVAMDKYHDRKEMMYAGIVIGEVMTSAVMMGIMSNIDGGLLLPENVRKAVE